MHRSFLVFGVAFIALMAGALFYAARMPVQDKAPVTAAAPAGAAVSTAPAVGAGPVYPDFSLADLEGNTREMSEWAGDRKSVV